MRAAWSRFAVLCLGGLLLNGPLLAVAEDHADPAPSHDGLDWSQAKETLVAKNLEHPVDIDVAPDGSLWFAEVFDGRVVRLDPEDAEEHVMYEAPIWKSEDYSERGLEGLALSPDFAKDRAFYIYYTHTDARAELGLNRLSRVVDGKETILLDGIPAGVHHNGGRIAFAPDGTLFVSTGDNDQHTPAQDPSSLLGKVLHLTREGAPTPDDIQGPVYSLGHRNVYGLAVDPETGAVYATENSGLARDEVNLLRAGKNYGYPTCEGFEKVNSSDACPSAFEPPLGEFYSDRTSAPTGLTLWRGQVYWASFNEGSIHHLWKDAQGAWKDEVVYDPEGVSPILDIVPTQDGKALYYSTWSSVWRLDVPAAPPTETGKAPTNATLQEHAARPAPPTSAGSGNASRAGNATTTQDASSETGTASGAASNATTDGTTGGTSAAQAGSTAGADVAPQPPPRVGTKDAVVPPGVKTPRLAPDIGGFGLLGGLLVAASLARRTRRDPGRR